MEVEIPGNKGKRCHDGLRYGQGTDGEFGCEDSYPHGENNERRV